MAVKQDKYKEWLENELRNHRGKWLDMEAVIRYRKMVLKLPDPEGALVGEKRNIWMDLIEAYGVTELEACNILNGHGGQDYVAKYERIRNQQPLIIVEAAEIESGIGRTKQMIEILKKQRKEGMGYW